MATPGREYSLDHHLLERLRYCGIEHDNLTDLVGIVVSLKNKYGIVPFAVEAEGHPVRNALGVDYELDSMTINKILNILLDTPRLKALTIAPRGIPRSTQFDIHLALGG